MLGVLPFSSRPLSHGLPVQCRATVHSTMKCMKKTGLDEAVHTVFPKTFSKLWSLSASQTATYHHKYANIPH